MSIPTIDLNCDTGESYGRFRIGDDATLLPLVSSCNIACGFHGGDPLQIETTIRLALDAGVSLGAHPSYPDLQGFGRRKMQLPPAEVTALIRYQVAAVAGIARSLGGRLRHVKPHGALYNSAAADEAEAVAIAAAVHSLDATLALVGPPDSALQRAAEAYGLPFLREGFADRRYAADGSLLPRSVAGAVIDDPAEVVEQVLGIVKRNEIVTATGTKRPLRVDTICIHGDEPGASANALAIRRALAVQGVAIKAS